MYDHIRPEGGALPIDWLVTPGLAFSHPNEVLVAVLMSSTSCISISNKGTSRLSATLLTVP
jgi:hypothetical protein